MTRQLYAGPSFDNNFCSIYETKEKNSLVMTRYQLFEQQPGSCYWLKKTTEVSLSFPEMDSEVVAVILGESSESIFVLLSAAIVKFSKEGRILFRRTVQVEVGEGGHQETLHVEDSTSQKKKRKSLSKGPAVLAKKPKSVLQFAEVAGQLWILHSQGTLSCWSSTYGIHLQSVTLPGATINSLEGKLFWFLPTRFDTTSGGDKNGLSIRPYIHTYISLHSYVNCCRNQ